MPDPADTTNFSESAARAFADFVARIAADDDVDIDAVCRERPEIADQLRWAYSVWMPIARGLEHGDVGIDACMRQLSHQSVQALRRLEDREAEESGDSWGAVLERLAAHAPHESRYVVEGDIDAGGMGTIRRVWDRDLRRTLAMKQMHEAEPDGADAARQQRAIGRFLEEAQITAQLDHPGVVPIHELGLDERGRVYFTMKLVKGAHLGAIFDKARARSEGWNETRAVGVLLRVCEAMAFAHSKGVVHRDLKPANVMVGRFGETYVMDWGLARVVDRNSAAAAPAPGPSVSQLVTDRKVVIGDRPDSPLLTKDGDVLGTPPYMAPEQALGSVDMVGFRSDVYSVGAMLYQLLTGCVPYVTPGKMRDAQSVWQAVLDGPPPPVESIAPQARPELVSICERAMARDVDDRYASIQELAGELRAYLEGRVVKAHETGAVAELKKWVRRNRAVAASLAAVALALVAGVSLWIWSEGQRRADTERMLAVRVAAELVDEARTGLGPIDPQNADARRDWLHRARELLRGEVSYRAQLAELRVDAKPVIHFRDETTELLESKLAQTRLRIAKWRPQLEAKRSELERSSDTAALERLLLEERELERHTEQLATLERAITAARPWSLPNPETQKLHDHLTDLARHLDLLTDAEHGLVAKVERELETAENLAASTVGTWNEAWRRAVESIRTSPLYRGLALEPQVGLVPLGEDAHSGLWEFWHVLSGSEPRRDASGALAIGPETGIVLVLLPGDPEFALGAKKSPDAANPDPNARKNEGPIRTVALAPLFLAKFEMTQGQWVRAAGDNPSTYFAGGEYNVGRLLADQPVESVTWREARAVLDRYGLVFPTEAQLEYAIRGGTSGPHWWSDVADFDESGINWYRSGRTAHWPVHRGPPNPFGLHNIAGNVSELCADWYARTYEAVEIVPGTGELRPVERKHRSKRGGSFASPKGDTRSARRVFQSPDDRRSSTGVRAARAITAGA